MSAVLGCGTLSHNAGVSHVDVVRGGSDVSGVACFAATGWRSVLDRPDGPLRREMRGSSPTPRLATPRVKHAPCQACVDIVRRLGMGERVASWYMGLLSVAYTHVRLDFVNLIGGKLRSPHRAWSVDGPLHSELRGSSPRLHLAKPRAKHTLCVRLTLQPPGHSVRMTTRHMSRSSGMAARTDTNCHTGSKGRCSRATTAWTARVCQWPPLCQTVHGKS